MLLPRIMLLGGMLLGWLALSGQALSQMNDIILTVAIEDWRSDMLTERVLKDFYEAHPGVQVVRAPLNSDNLYYTFDVSDTEGALEKARAVFSSGDVIIASEFNLGMLATRAGYVLDLMPYTHTDSSGDLNDFYPVALKAFEWDNGLWALPAGLHGQYMAYDPAAFDAVNYPYPDSSWTLEQYFEAGLALTTRDAKGAVTLPGFAGFNEPILFRALYGHGIYDTSTQPETPHLTDPDLVTMLYQFDAYTKELIGDYPYPDTVDWSKVPIQMGDLQLFSRPETKHYVPVLFPGETSFVSADGFAISAGTPYPDLSYALVKYLTGKIDIATRFYSELPARRSLDGQSTGNTREGEITYTPVSIPDSLKAVTPKLLETGFSNAELRYTNYIVWARGKRWEDETLTFENVLEWAQEKALKDLARAEEERTVGIVITRPVPTPLPAADKITLTFALITRYSPLSNPQDWERVAQEFVAADPQVGAINLAPGAFITEDSPEIDCAYTFFNAVPLTNLSLLQPLDPFLATDPSFDRRDIPDAVWPLITQENRIYGLPMTLVPLMIWYRPNSFEATGLPMPENGWTVGEFVDALAQLKDAGATTAYRSQRMSNITYLMLAVAFGGVPIDYSTAVPTYHLSDPKVIEALRQTLDLARNGSIEYVRLDPSSDDLGVIQGDDAPALYDAPGTLYNWGLARSADSPHLPVTFPRGTDMIPVAYNLGAAYITSQTLYPEACYRWLSTVAQHPELFTEMPVRMSQATSDALIAAHGQHASDLYTDLFDVLNNPEVAIIPNAYGNPTSPQEIPPLIWFNQALDAYVLEDAVLETVLTEAQSKIDEYVLCTASLPSPDRLNSDPSGDEEYNQKLWDCAGDIDPLLRKRLNG